MNIPTNKHLLFNIEYQKENGEITLMDVSFCNWNKNKRGEEYLTVMCHDERNQYRRIHPDRIISMRSSKLVA